MLVSVRHFLALDEFLSPHKKARVRASDPCFWIMHLLVGPKLSQFPFLLLYLDIVVRQMNAYACSSVSSPPSSSSSSSSNNNSNKSLSTNISYMYFGNDLNEDMIILIFSFLHPKDILSIENCCQQFKKISMKSVVWISHLERIWQRAIFNKPSTVLLSERIKSLSITALKSILKDVNTTNCIEKTDYQDAVAARLFFRNRKYPIPLPRKLDLPHWSLNMNDHKASYYFSRQERRRTHILKSELCSIVFRFYFKHSPEDGGWNCRFSEDFTMISQLHGEGVMSWQFIDYNHVDGGNRIQVEQYPILTLRRLASISNNGAWEMENMYVKMQQVALNDCNNNSEFLC